jgi:hypothetical protein
MKNLGVCEWVFKIGKSKKIHEKGKKERNFCERENLRKTKFNVCLWKILLEFPFSARTNHRNSHRNERLLLTKPEQTGSI